MVGREDQLNPTRHFVAHADGALRAASGGPGGAVLATAAGVRDVLGDVAAPQHEQCRSVPHTGAAAAAAQLIDGDPHGCCLPASAPASRRPRPPRKGSPHTG